jgi:hypothetical protein
MHAAVALVFLVSFVTVVTFAQTAARDPMTVLAEARAALGGEARIAGVKTFIANGRTRQIRGNNLVPIEFEIQAELPARYSRRDEVPAQDTAPSLSGFNGDTLVLVPPLPPAQAAAAAGRVAIARQDLARLLLGMFATAMDTVPLTFNYAGEAEAPQGKADVLAVSGPANFNARLFIDRQTHLPLLITWTAPAGPARGGPPRAGGPPREGGPPPPPAAPPVEQRMFFADHRDVDGLKLPFRIRRAAGADTTEETTFDRFRINARVDPRRFQSGG